MSSGLSTQLFKTATTHNPNRKIPTRKAFELLRECAKLGVKAIQFTGGGEPTVHPDHLDIFLHAQQLGLETSLVTNGVKLSASDQSVLGMSWIRVSVDAGRSATYSRVRRVPEVHWKRVWANISKLAKHFSGTLGIGFVVTPENYQEAHLAAKRARESGAENIRIGAVFSERGSKFYGKLIPKILERIERAKGEERPGFKVYDLFSRRISDLDAQSPKHSYCGYQHLTTYIGGDLNLYRCCNTAYTPHGKIGSLEDRSLEDLLKVMDDFDARKCRFCQFQGQNEAIRNAITPPEHANFV